MAQNVHAPQLSLGPQPPDVSPVSRPEGPVFNHERSIRLGHKVTLRVGVRAILNGIELRILRDASPPRHEGTSAPPPDHTTPYIPAVPISRDLMHAIPRARAEKCGGWRNRQSSKKGVNRLLLEVVRVDGEPVSVLLNGKEFACEAETGETVIPKNHLAGVRLSAIPDDIIVKPVESIEGNIIHVQNDIGLCRFSARSATASVEEWFRRKFWDGEVGLSPYVAALRQAIVEHESTSETDFQDDDDYIFLHYKVTLTQDMDIALATELVEGVIGGIQRRADQLVARRRDGLLGIFDRGSFDADLSHALRNARQGVELAMADIDHFKQVNDNYGHRAGDAVLRAVAQVLSDRSTPNTVPYRYGGEELAVIITGADERSAARFAESVRADVEKLSFDDPTLKITLSLGVAVAPGDGKRAEELVKKADARLYRAKHEGRNCVRTAD